MTNKTYLYDRFLCQIEILVLKMLNRFMQILYFIRDRFRWQKNCDLFKQK